MNLVQPRPEIDPDHFRRVMGRFATGVTVITATTGGETRGITANAFMSGSLDPPLCIVSIARRARMHPHITGAGAFGVSILVAGQEDIATHFAGRPVIGLAPVFHDLDGVATVGGAGSMIAAETVARHDCGDHTVFIGHIHAMWADDRPPLLYHAGRFAALVPLREPAPAMPEFW
jgi:flavin reductase (DIM6/NTAB) family NADH-FMN oxidoreductase RutF